MDSGSMDKAGAAAHYSRVEDSTDGRVWRQPVVEDIFRSSRSLRRASSWNNIVLAPRRSYSCLDGEDNGCRLFERQASPPDTSQTSITEKTPRMRKALSFTCGRGNTTDNCTPDMCGDRVIWSLPLQDP
ncbi:hypothetical protein MTO96_006721 [Rhipicephalus appendiculatus]